MRTLEFKVTAQQLECDGDFTNIVAGTSGYLQAHFTFSDEWNGCTKAASFFNNGIEHARILKNDYCIIPTESLTRSIFYVQITGKKSSYKIKTNKVKVKQEVV
ncbi:MAG: hypothetical protein LUF78_10745 [Clostridiales bacterium]|nr:hypothetical protein [Clostridiales bacterium]